MKLLATLAVTASLALPACSKDKAGTGEGDQAGLAAAADPGPPTVPSLGSILAEAEPAAGQSVAGAPDQASPLGALGLGSLGGGQAAAEAAPAGSAPTPATAGRAAASGDCARVGAKLAALVKAEMKSQLAQVPADQRAMVEAQLGMADGMLAELPQQIISLCTTQGWPRQLTDCILAATAVSAIQGCEQFMPAGMAGAIGTGPGYGSGYDDSADSADDDWAESGSDLDVDLGKPVSAPPKWNGKSKDCNAVADHVVAIALYQVSGMPADQQAMARDMTAQVKTMLAEQCTSGPWPEVTRLCILKAQTEGQLEACGAM